MKLSRVLALCSAISGLFATNSAKAQEITWCGAWGGCNAPGPGPSATGINLWLRPDMAITYVPIETASFASSGILGDSYDCGPPLPVTYGCSFQFTAICPASWFSNAGSWSEFGDFHGDIEAGAGAATGPPSFDPDRPSIVLQTSTLFETKCCQWSGNDCISSSTARGVAYGWAATKYQFRAVANLLRGNPTWTLDGQIQIPALNGEVVEQVTRQVALIGDFSAQTEARFVIKTTDHEVHSIGLDDPTNSGTWSGDIQLTGPVGEQLIQVAQMTYKDNGIDINEDGRFNEFDPIILSTLLGSIDENHLKWDFDGSEDINSADVEMAQLLVDLELDSGVFGDLSGDSIVDCSLVGGFSSYLGLGLSDSNYRIELDYNLDGEIDFTDQIAFDCNSNSFSDFCDIEGGSSTDLNSNGVPDECDDCNDNGMSDIADISQGTSADCNGDYFPDECGPDCNANGILDICEIFDGTSSDCNENGVPDDCDLAESEDCNTNGILDECDIVDGYDCNSNGTVDSCEISKCVESCEFNNCCDTNHGVGCTNPVIESCVCAVDEYCCDTDWDAFCVPLAEENCGACVPTEDCNSNSVPDECEEDCNSNGINDECDISNSTSQDSNTNGVPDECNTCLDEDVNCDGVVSALDIAKVQAPLNWSKTCDQAAEPRADVNRDGTVSPLDLAEISAPLNWGATTPFPCECAIPTCP